MYIYDTIIDSLVKDCSKENVLRQIKTLEYIKEKEFGTTEDLADIEKALKTLKEIAFRYGVSDWLKTNHKQYWQMTHFRPSWEYRVGRFFRDTYGILFTNQFRWKKKFWKRYLDNSIWTVL
jgi:hypothetical protein